MCTDILASWHDLGIIVTQGRHCEFASLRKRQESFQSWIDTYTFDPKTLPGAGFYYVMHGDSVKCFWCGGGLRSFKQRDHGFIEHARFFPQCTFLKHAKGQHFIDIVTRLNNSRGGGNITYDEVMTEVLTTVKSPAITALVKLGFPPYDLIQTAVTLDAEYSVTSDVLLNVLFNHVFTTHNTRSIEHERFVLSTLKVENNKLHRDITCKVCWQKRSSILYLNCGHLATCYECDFMFKTCPVCQQEIKVRLQIAISAHFNTATCSSFLQPMSERKLVECQIKALEIENDLLSKMTKCIVCKTRSRDVTLLPCRDFCLCSPCSDLLSTCPVCNSQYLAKVKTYLT